MQVLLEKFINSFQKAITVEMEAMRQRLGPFEVPLADGKALEGTENDKWKFYGFTILQPNDKLVLQAECTLVHEKGEVLVTITELTQDKVTLRSEREIDLRYPPYTLVIYPWFLYEKLKHALESLLQGQNFFVPNALMLFGKHPPHKQAQPLLTEHPGLNDSQQQALQLCSDNNLAFVWGPPGTGKTTTLGHIVTELLRQGQRILITSTTNAAVDQALAKLAALGDAREFFERGHIVRIGQTTAETFGATLPQVIKRLHAKTQARLEYLSSRCGEISQHIDQCGLIVEKLNSANRHVQTDLFQAVKVETITTRDLRLVFSEKFARNILMLPVEQQQELVARRQKRLQLLLKFCQTKMRQHRQELRNQETTVVQKTRVILATMTSVYMSSLLQEERFDTVIVEEAGMAILPTVFYCAALAQKKVIMVGDPQQLPPIVQSRADYVYRAMGRNIFEVGTTNSQHAAETIVMLNTQYRMHPVIGDLVSGLFYDGKLRHGEDTAERRTIAAKEPYPDAPLIVIDTENSTTCAVREGSYSRFNEKTAQICVDLAVEAVRSGIDSVAIITPYVAQSRLIRQLLSKYRNEIQHVDCQTVHRFQGGERDMVILDTVDASPLSPGVLLASHSSHSSSQNLINVSISRARGKLIIIADVSYFRSNSPKSIINKVLRQAMQTGIRASLTESRAK
jgi:superfamily I DNA and/or RNA helicase